MNSNDKLNYGDIWKRILKAALSIPGAKIDRKEFLRTST